MSNSFDNVISRWNEAVDNDDFKAGLMIALEGYNLSLRSKDAIREREFLYFIKLAVSKVEQGPEKGPPENNNICSFCCEVADDKSLVRGPAVAICPKCVRDASELIQV